MNLIDFPRLGRRFLVAVLLTSFGWSSLAFAQPTITSQTGDQTVSAGSNASFSVTASGIAPLSYQWRKNTGGSGSTNIAGATSSTYTITNAQAADAAGYYCQVSDSSGPAWSGTVHLTVTGAPPTIASQTWNQTVNAGATATFSVTAGGSAPFTYQWRKSINGSATDIPGATSSSYVINNAQSTDVAGYYCQVTNGYGVNWSGTAQLAVTGVAPTIASQTWNQTVNAGATATFSVTAGGSAPFTYQWRKSINGSATNIPGATSSSYVINNAQSTDVAGYYCQVTNSYGVNWSGTAQLSVNPVNNPPAITNQSQGQSVPTGGSVTLSVTATGSPTLTYQWSKGSASISGANASTYTISSFQSSDVGSYTCVVSNSYGTATSSAAQLTVGAAAAFTFFEQPRSQRANPGPGKSVAFSVTTSGGSGNPTYQWWHGNAAVSGETAATLRLDNLQSSAAGTYYVIVTDAGVAHRSIPATLTIEPVPSPAPSPRTVMDVHTAAPKVLVVVVQTATANLPPNSNTPDDLSAYLQSTTWAVDGTTILPSKIHRYSIPWDEDEARASDGSYPVRTRHRLYLELSSTLGEGPHSLTTPDGTVSFEFHSLSTFCESIKVNQVGYNGSSHARYANFGIFMGDGGTQAFDASSPTTLPTYDVIDESTGLSALTSPGTVVKLDAEIATFDGNGKRIWARQDTGEQVYRFDLSGVPPGGPYFVTVPGAGRSRSFGVGADYSQYLSYVTFRGLYHQRCGMALVSPYTAWTHAICHDKIDLWLRSEQAQDDVDVTPGEDTDPVEGGYHDAADMDHTTAHPQISIDMLSFYEAFRPSLEGRRYNIPTSEGETAQLPDFLQEILWGVKLWENLQIQDPADPAFGTYHGAVMSGWSTNGGSQYGVEDADHDPRLHYGTMSVNPDVILPEDLNHNGHYEPNEFIHHPGQNKSTAFAAGIFAHTSRLLRQYHDAHAVELGDQADELLDRANELRDRAIAAWGYLTRSSLGVNHAQTHFVYAALQLYLATGEAQYGNVFVTQARALLFPSTAHGQSDGPESNREGYRPGNIYMYCQTPHFASYLLLSPGQLPAGDAQVVDNDNNGLQAALQKKVTKYADEGTEFATLPTTISTEFPHGTPYPLGIKNLDQYGGGGTVAWGSATTQGRYADVLMYAYRLASEGTSTPAKDEQKQRYLNGVSLFADYSVGLNPLGMSYYTGLGTDQPNSPLHCNSWTTKYGFVVKGTAGPEVHRDAADNPIGNVPGILIYGPMWDPPDTYYERPVVAKLHPAWESLPPQRRYADGWSVVKVNEFTTHETMVWNLLMYAFLATH